MPQTDVTLASLTLALPEIYLTVMICVVLMVDVFAGPTLGLFGQFNNRDRVYAEVRYSF